MIGDDECPSRPCEQDMIYVPREPMAFQLLREDHEALSEVVHGILGRLRIVEERVWILENRA